MINRPGGVVIDATRQVFSGLLGRDVTLKPAGANLPLPAPALLSVYETDTGTAVAVLAVDLALAAAAGAALSLIPARVAAEAVKAKKLPDGIRENYEEIANVFSSVLNVPGGPHLRFRATLTSPPAPPADVATLLRGKPIQLVMTIASYGDGRLDLFVPAGIS